MQQSVRCGADSVQTLSSQPWVASGTRDINKRPWLHQRREHRHGPCQRPRSRHQHGPEWQASHPPQPTPHLFCLLRYGSVYILSLSHIPPHTVAHHNRAFLLGTARWQAGLCFFLRAQGRLCQAIVWVSSSCSVCHGTGQDPALHRKDIIMVPSRLESQNAVARVLSQAGARNSALHLVCIHG